MRTPGNRIQRRRGVTFIEILIASLILGLMLSSLVRFWYFSFTMTSNADSQGLAYSIARRVMERAKETGFTYTPEGTSVLYYDENGGNESASSMGTVMPDGTTKRPTFAVTTTVVSDRFTTNAQGVTSPALNSLRTVTVTVTLVTSGKVLYQTSTYLARGGV